MAATKRGAIEDLKRRLVEGLQILTGEGVLTGSGHLSARIPGTESFLINPRFPGVLAEVSDICTVNFAGKRISGKGPIPSETPIHTAVYRERPDVGSVVHCHARHAILVGLQDMGLVPFHREAESFADGVPVYPDSRGINDNELAGRMMETLASHRAIFLRGHGCVVVGPGIEGTCVSVIQLERACGDQILLMSFTTPKPIAELGRGKSEKRLENPYRAWPFLLHKHRIKPKSAIRSYLNKRVPGEGEHY